MKVYVVTSGEYSDFGINSIFSTKELAQQYIDKCRHCDSSGSDINDNIEEWDVDETRTGELIPRRIYASLINLDNGDLEQYNPESTWRKKQTELGRPTDRVYNIQYDYYFPGDFNRRNNNGFVSVESFVSQDHADKVAVEARQAFLRNSYQGLQELREKCNSNVT